MNIHNIHAKNISKSFEGISLFQNLNIEMSLGDCILICGKNGVGKTTLINVMSGLIMSDTGNQDYLEKEKFRFQFGYISSNQNSFFSRLSVKQNLDFFINMRNLNLSTNINMVFNDLNLDKKLLFKQYMYLSSGEKKKISIARSFLHNPSIIFMDEPLNYLDKNFKKIFIDFLKKKLEKKEIMLMVASHHEKYFEKIYTKKIELVANGCLPN